MRELDEELALWLTDQGLTDDITGASLRRAWLAETESQRLELPPEVRDAMRSGGSLRVPVQPSTPDLAAIAEMNKGGDPEDLLMQATRRRNVAIALGLVFAALVFVLAVLIGTGIIVTGE
ncbi:MAG TPA: hypothetical protein PKD61_34765, partial [Polyangiaceae bacterium]|nr:hypothetical protein [Polyangiaceae bacterium]